MSQNVAGSNKTSIQINFPRVLMQFIFHFSLFADPETDFPSLADLQNSLLSECLKKNPLITACKSLLKTALSDPGSAGLSVCIKLTVFKADVTLSFLTSDSCLVRLVLGLSWSSLHASLPKNIELSLSFFERRS